METYFATATDHTSSNIISRDFVEIKQKRILGGLKAYLRATDHTCSNIISGEIICDGGRQDKQQSYLPTAPAASLF
jgi:hypothetical protein